MAHVAYCNLVGDHRRRHSFHDRVPSDNQHSFAGGSFFTLLKPCLCFELSLHDCFLFKRLFNLLPSAIMNELLRGAYCSCVRTVEDKSPILWQSRDSIAKLAPH